MKDFLHKCFCIILSKVLNGNWWWKERMKIIEFLWNISLAQDMGGNFPYAGYVLIHTIFKYGVTKYQRQMLRTNPQYFWLSSGPLDFLMFNNLKCLYTSALVMKILADSDDRSFFTYSVSSLSTELSSPEQNVFSFLIKCSSSNNDFYLVLCWVTSLRSF